jgi:predicted RNA methylase
MASVSTEPSAKELRGTRRALRFRVGGGEPPRAVDVEIDGRRVWSTATSPRGADGWYELAWPRALRPYLQGSGQVRVVDGRDGAELAEGTVRFTGARRAPDITDSRGRPLTVNKWLRMGTTLEARGSDLQNVLLERTQELVALLDGLGYEVCVTGGTLLGAVRSGALMPQDDDTDLAVVLPYDDPAELSLASYRLEDDLVAAGLTVVHHSNAHLQVNYLRPDGAVDHYIDVFLGFFRRGEYCQPFHIREPMERSSILPRSTVHINGAPFPAPARPEDWLAACYGPGWKVPDPSFRFVTPLSTRRRYDAWFGSQNQHRNFWESYWARLGDAALDHGMRASTARRTLRGTNPGIPILDLGAGSGRFAVAAAALGHRVVAVDYSYRALGLIRERARLAGVGDLVQARFLNLGDRRRVLELAAELVHDGPWLVRADHVLESVSEDALEATMLMARELLRDGGVMRVTLDTSLTPTYSADDPRTWNRTVDEVSSVATAHGLEVRTVGRGSRWSRQGPRLSAALTLVRTR